MAGRPHGTIQEVTRGRLMIGIRGDGDSFAYDPNPNSFNNPPNDFTYPPQPQYESYSCELCGNDSLEHVTKATDGLD
ncbi:hypothetical protein Tco_1123637 [Tanacetum coccineum]|uniref:Uncharacterized protein n=1 Tax=Tanacetum coccineum TaxID=301880 RepID=A0ABQ5J400_9ASTR